MSAGPPRHLDRLLGAVAAEGTDPDALLAVLGWVVRPRRPVDTLRRRCLADGQDAAPPAGRLAAAAGEPDADVQQAVAQVLATWRDLAVEVALVGDRSYPRQLALGWPEVEAPPFLAWRGRPPAGEAQAAFVGARRATGYGTGVTAWLAETVSRSGVRVVSGGALGIDAAAHAASLEEPGGTTAVLGCGHAAAYPRDHAAPGGLFDRIVDRGGTILSEQLPTEPPRPWTVRARNRIVAGTSEVVVVVEGGARSGALLTASAAADRGIPVLAVPGDVRAPGSAAPHRLLAEGAAPCTSPADILGALRHQGVAEAEAAPAGARPDAGGSAGSGGLPTGVHEVLVAAWPRPIRVDELVARSGCQPATLLAALTRARLAGLIAEGVDGVRLRRAPG